MASPHRIGRYELQDELGRGGMATVHRAHDPHFRRDVAVKILPREFLHDPTFRARFEREARTIAGLEHYAIVPVYDFGEQDGQPYLVMRFMPGGSLTDLIRRGALSLDDAARIATPIAAALDDAHKAGVIHRDVKPANILFGRSGQAHLTDFGIVKLTEATAQLTGSGMVGTPAYMAPEMTRRGGVSPLVDVYALGVTVFQMLTGRLPFEADTPMGTALAHITTPIPDIHEFRPDLPSDAQAVVERAMAKDPADRYQSAGELVGALRTVAAGEQLGADAPPPAPRAASRAKRMEPDPPAREPGDTLPPGDTWGVASAAPDSGADRPHRGVPSWVWLVGAVVGVALLAGAALLLGWLPVGGVFGNGASSTTAATSTAAGNDEPTAEEGSESDVEPEEDINWDAENMGLLGTLEDHTGTVLSVAFSPDGSKFASGSYDESIILWDTASWKPLQTLEDHHGGVLSLDFSPDGSMLASGSIDNKIFVWER